MSGFRCVLFVSATLLSLVACTKPAPPTRFDTAVKVIEQCPVDDGSWLEAVRAAEEEQRVGELNTLVAGLRERCAPSWAPDWTAGRCRLGADQPRDAQPLLERALVLAEEHDAAVGVARSRNQLGWAAYVTGELEAAMEHYDAALVAARRAGRVDLESFIYSNSAGALVDLGDFAAAGERLRRAESGLRALGRKDAARGVGFNRSALLLELGDVTAARALLEQVHEEAAAADDGWTLDASSVLLGNLHLMLAESDAAERWHSQVGTNHPELRMLADLGRGRAALQRGDATRAVTRLTRAAERARDDPRLYSGAMEVYLAEAQIRNGAATEARERIEALLESAADDLPADMAWAARWILGRALLDEGRKPEATVALQASVDHLEQQRSPLDPVGAGLHFLRQRFEPYADLAVTMSRSDTDDSEDDSAGDEGLFEVISRAQARSLRHALHFEALERPKRSDLKSLRRRLGADEWIIGYTVGDERSLLYAINRDGFHSVPIAGRQEWIDDLLAYRSALQQPLNGDGEASAWSAEANAIGLRLRQQLIGPIEERIATARRVYFVPDRELALLPFAAVPEPESGFLGDRVEVGMLPLADAPALPRVAGRPVLLAGQPVLEPESEFEPLPWAAYELSRLDALWTDQVTPLRGEQFSLAALGELPLTDFGLLHFATHAVAAQAGIGRTGVVLSSGERLGVREILDLRLHGGLVVLSACRTGEGELLPGEGVIGLGWALLRAGAGGLVVSLWSVDDVASARMMVAMHRDLRRGVDPVRALSDARRETAKANPHPAFWAPFVTVVRPAGAAG